MRVSERPSSPTAWLFTAASRDCDVLVHMCHFLRGTALNSEFGKRNMGHLELARLGAEAHVRNLVISHVTEQFDRPGVRERVIREMSEIYKGSLFFGEDLMEIPAGALKAGKLDRDTCRGLRMSHDTLSTRCSFRCPSGCGSSLSPAT